MKNEGRFAPFDSEKDAKIIEALTTHEYAVDRAVGKAGGNFDRKEINPKMNEGFPRIEPVEENIIMLTPGSINRIIWDTIVEGYPELGLYTSSKSKGGSVSKNPYILYVDSKTKEGLKIFNEIINHPIIQTLQIEISDPNLDAEFDPSILDEETTEKCYARYYEESIIKEGLRKPNAKPLTDDEARAIVKKVIVEVLNRS